MFCLTDLGGRRRPALVLGAALPALVLVMAVASRADIKQRRGRSPALAAFVLFLTVVSPFRRLQVQPSRRAASALPDAGVHVGRASVWMGHREPRAAVSASRGPPRRPPSWGRTSWAWCPGSRAAATAEARDLALLAEIDRLHVRTGYAGFWVAPNTVPRQGRVVLSGELGPIVSWGIWTRGAGPGCGSGRLSRWHRGACGSSGAAQGACVSLPADRRLRRAIFHDLCRRVSLEEVAGYDLPAGSTEPPEHPERPVGFSTLVTCASNSLDSPYRLT